jgi:hypothetical protein
MSLLGDRSVHRATSAVKANERSVRARAAALGAGLLVAACALVAPPPADAYVVCSAQCPHEYMAIKALQVFPAGEIASNFASVQAGITEEDEFDHVYGLNIDIPLAGQPLVTATHFWNADLGPDAPATNAAILGTFQNSWQKVRALWMLALGAYARGDKPKAYHYLGHIVHHFGDNTVPAHVHDDPHGPEPIDDDSFHDWMDTKDDNGGDPTNARVSAAEIDALHAAGPIAIPEGESDGLHFLLYDENEFADFFASDDYDGDSTAAGYDGSSAGRDAVQAELNKLAGDPSLVRLQDHDAFDDNDSGDDNDDGDLGVVRQYSYLRGIRSIAALYKLFEQTVRDQITASVTIDEVTANDWHDYGEVCGPNPLDPFGDDICARAKVSSADFYARLDMGNRHGRNRGEQAKNDDHIAPGWAFGHSVGTSGTLPVRVEIWDHDGAYDEFTTGGSDDISDIKPGDGTGLNLNVDIAKCLTGAAGAVSGDATGKCGEPITSSGGDHLEASTVRFTIRLSKSPPKADAGGPYTTDEGTNVELDATGSSDPDDDITTYAWDLDGDGACDDVVNDATPDFTAVGQDGSTTVKVCVTDAVGLTAEDTATVTVKNVTPKVTMTAPGAVKEHDTVTVGGTISDPGWLDTPTATIDWGDGSGPHALGGDVERDRPDATLTFSTTHVYGDNGSFTVKVCGSDDDATACESSVVQVANVAPTAKIAAAGSVLVNGVPTFLAHAGQAVTLTGNTTDPGSDDLTLAWNWGDGSPVESSISLVNPPNADGLPSPTDQPRNESQTRSHAYGKACAFETTFSSTDDDAGSAGDTANVIIVGNAVDNGLVGFWSAQFKSYLTGHGKPKYDAPTLTCYLTIARYMSRVFDEKTPATTFAQADAVLSTAGTSDMVRLFDQQLLAAWLNFANGAIEYDQLVDTDANRTLDTPFLQAMADAEAVRLNPSTTRAQLERKKNMLDAFNRLP